MSGGIWSTFGRLSNAISAWLPWKCVRQAMSCPSWWWSSSMAARVSFSLLSTWLNGQAPKWPPRRGYVRLPIHRRFMKIVASQWMDLFKSHQQPRGAGRRQQQQQQRASSRAGPSRAGELAADGSTTPAPASCQLLLCVLEHDQWLQVAGGNRIWGLRGAVGQAGPTKERCRAPNAFPLAEEESEPSSSPKPTTSVASIKVAS